MVERRVARRGVVAVGTACLRIASNRQMFLDAVKQRTGIDVEVISGEEEGRLAYIAATSALPIAAAGSSCSTREAAAASSPSATESRVDERFSVDVGAVRFTERFGLAERRRTRHGRAALTAIAGDLTRLDGPREPAGIIGMGGTATNLTAVKHGLAEYDPDVVHGTVLTLDEIDREIDSTSATPSNGERSRVCNRAGRR